MFAISTKQQQYETYILADQNSQSQLEVVPERGGIITNWRIQNHDILYFDSERFADPSLSVRGGIPILFPICGNLPDNTYTYNGESYTLKQHGFARDLPWTVAQKVTNNLASLSLVLNSNDQTRTVYPFDFQLTFTYILLGNTVEIKQRYSNHSNKAMPFSTGLHPYFFTSDKSKLDYEIPSSQYQDQITKKVHPFSGSFDLSSDEIDVAFWQLSDNCASVSDTAGKLKLTLTYSDIYSTLVFWTVKSKDYYCLEPWSAPRNAINTGEHLIELPPGASCETYFKMTATFF